MLEDIILNDEQTKGVAEVACLALHNRRVLEVIKGGIRSRVHVHAVGVNKEGRAVIFGYEYRSTPEYSYDWRYIYLDELLFLRITDEKSDAPMLGYVKPDASIMKMYEEAD